jgi:ectoine hydroxylase-related dioxygenase (phytanoyl-CoA dioxygenase family)
MAMQDDYLEQFHRDGFTVIRGVFDPAEVADLAAAFDAIHLQGKWLRTSYRHQNTLFRISDDARLGKTLRLVQWPSYFDTVLDRCRRDPRLFDLVAPIIGCDIKQIINQMHWKPPGAAQSTFGYHQDIWFRRPRSAYRNTERSYVQMGIAIDPHRANNGAMTFCPGSHKLGELSLSDDRRVMERPMEASDLRQLGIAHEDIVTLNLEPGDVAMWTLFTVHGSGPNIGDTDRRLYINGYVNAADCDRGEWTFRDGESCQLGKPVLVHYEDLHRRPEPHYIDER